LNEIAEITGVNISTLKKWCELEEWNQQNERMQNLPNLIYETYHCVVEAMRRLAQQPNFDPDEMTKRINHVRSLEPKESNYSDFTRLTADIIAFAHSKNPEEAGMVVKIFKEYAKFKFKHLYE
jgi:hypothetical protein